MPNRPDNDWPDEVKGIRKLSEAEARQHFDEPIATTDEGDKAEHRRQLAKDKQHPAWTLRDRDDEGA